MKKSKTGIVFCVGGLETLDYFSYKMEEGAQNYGYDTYIMDINTPDTYLSGELDKFTDRETCVAVFFNQLGTMLSDYDGRNYWMSRGVETYTIEVDHPRNFKDVLSNPIEGLNVISIDRKHKAFIERFYPAVKNVFFLPNGGAGETENNGIKPLAQRSIDVLYVGDCQQPVDGLPDIDLFDDKGGAFYKSTVGLLLSEPWHTTEEAIEAFFIKNGIKVTDEVLLYLNSTIAIYIETYVRREWKLYMMRTLDEKGITVEVYGNNWINPNYTYSNRIHIHDRVSSKKCNELISDAKITLNCMPWFKDGASERAFNTMQNGSLCFIDPSGYLKERFENKKDLVFFEVNDPRGLADSIKYYLNNIDEAQTIADRGLEKSLSDTWSERLKTIVEGAFI